MPRACAGCSPSRSADIYGPVDEHDLPLTEDQPIRPVSPYGASKAAADIMCLTAGLAHGLEVVRARSFNHLGPGQNNKFVASAIASRIVENERSGENAVRVGNLEARRDFTDVRDVVRAYRLLMTDGVAGDVYHVCSGIDRPVRELAELLISLSTGAMELVPDPDLFRPVDLKVLRGDFSKIRAATGWAPEIDIDTTLSDLLRLLAHSPRGRRESADRLTPEAHEEQRGQARTHHRHHRTGRLLPRRVPAREGLRGHRHGPPVEHGQLRAHRPPPGPDHASCPATCSTRSR